MMPANHAGNRAAELRAEFDRAFAAPPAAAAAAADNFLVIASGGERVLVRLRDISGLFVDRRVVTVPGADTALLGITGLRGAIVPVYRLGTLLGQPAAETMPRWLAVAAGAALAFAFDGLDNYLAVARDAIVPRGAGGALGGHVHDAAVTAHGTLPIVDLASVVRAVAAPHP
jgi:purine-binding chemotaxis protein CheW